MYKFLVVFFLFLLSSRTRVVKRRCWGRFGNTCSIYFFFLFSCPLFSFLFFSVENEFRRKQANLKLGAQWSWSNCSCLFKIIQASARRERRDKDLRDSLGQCEKGELISGMWSRNLFILLRHPHLERLLNATCLSQLFTYSLVAQHKRAIRNILSTFYANLHFCNVF